MHSGYKLFAFSVLGLRGILTACTNFLLKCKLLTSQSFHLFYLLMWDLNKYVEHLKFLPFLCFLRNKSHAYCTIYFLTHNMLPCNEKKKKKLIWGRILCASCRHKAKVLIQRSTGPFILILNVIFLIIILEAFKSSPIPGVISGTFNYFYPWLLRYELLLELDWRNTIMSSLIFICKDKIAHSVMVTEGGVIGQLSIKMW